MFCNLETKISRQFPKEGPSYPFLSSVLQYQVEPLTLSCSTAVLVIPLLISTQSVQLVSLGISKVLCLQTALGRQLFEKPVSIQVMKSLSFSYFHAHTHMHKHLSLHLLQPCHISSYCICFLLSLEVAI